MKIALVRCPCVQPFPPDIGLGYLISSLRETGIDVSLFDLNIEFFHNAIFEKKEKWLTSYVPVLDELAKEILLESPQIVNELANKIVKTKANIIGFSIWDSNIFFSLKLAEAIKRADKNIPIIFGGPECYPLFSGDFFIQKDFVDIVVFGEGELTLRQIIESIKKSGKVKAVFGCIIKEGDKIINCGPAELIGNLDTLPFPDYRDFPLDWFPNKARLFISFNRGCIRKCAYCSVSDTVPLFRFRSAHSIYEEIRCQMQRHPSVYEFLIASPALNSNLKQLSEFCDLIIKNGIKIDWGGNAIIHPDMDIDLLRKMRDSGCTNLVFGIESGSQKVLDRMGKSFRIKDAECLLYDVYRAGINSITANFIIGFPGEDNNDFYDTLEFIYRNKNYINSIGSYSTCWIEPYTPIYYNLKKYGVILNQLPYVKNYSDWYSEDKRNNSEIRQKRMDIFKDFISSVGLNTVKNTPIRI